MTKEDPMDVILAGIRKQVEAAMADLEMVLLNVGETLTAREVQDLARAAGHKGTIANLAFYRLIEDGTLAFNDDLTVTVK